MATFTGTAGDDTLFGGSDADTVRGLGGDDVVGGEGGADLVDGGDGNDTVVGGAGDTVKGGAGVDILELDEFGVAAAIDLTGMTETNTAVISGGIRVSGFEVVNVFTGGLNDHIVIGDVGAFVMAGGGADTIIGGIGHDYLRGGVGDDSLNGGAGLDRVGFFTEAPNGCTVDLRLQGAAQNTGAGMDVLIGFENVSGTAHADTIIGDNNANILWGSGDGTAAADGDDVLAGNGGNDLLIVGDGAHTVNGGDGIDTLSVYANSTDTWGGMVIDLNLQGSMAQNTTRGLMVIRNIENLNGSIHDDSFTGDRFANRMAGEDGDDTLRGGASGDHLYGDGRIESAWAYGISGPQGEWQALYEDDVTPGADVLDGGKGDDVIAGGGESDQLTGGGGSDTFRYFRLEDSAVGEEDFIHDFNTTNDVLDVSGIDADDAQVGDQAFTLVNAFTGVAGQAALFYDRAEGITSVQLDTDGDSEADAVILVNGRLTIANMGDGTFVA